MRSLVRNPEPPAQQRETVALEGRQQDARQIEGVEDQPRAERVREERTEEEEIEGPTVSDQRRVAAEGGEPGRCLERRRRAQDVRIGEADQPLNRERDRDLRIDDQLHLVERPE